MSSGQIIMQIVLLLATIGLAVFFVSQRKKARAKAGVKLGFLVFLISCIWAIVRPDDLTVVANWLGVSRGTDLLLYLLVVAFMFTTISSYIRFREQELRYARLARAVALQTAVRPEAHDPSLDGTDPKATGLEEK
ncbi:hypothetical protein CCICO_10820 [Corynebacterium ciconiae DSM 44920]|uniref:DUF2304 domain-containing protein n=1 Tax=Corynebacterium ciconiae TaxID=227319 RepID=UPI000374543E|nr:DUF2304 domain-containing protein [Corynebacterium ciconiae]WKD62162.1 hypothetical protein CCICO_10820 [Corynebacterium ciconiae DSM 44920]